MPSLQFEELPGEILQQIASCLDANSLNAFSLTSQQCNEVANMFVFQNMCISIWNRETLRQDIDGWSRTLERRSSFQHVRRLQIGGQMAYASEETGPGNLLGLKQSRKRRAIDSDDDFDLVTFLEPGLDSLLPDTRPPQEAWAEDDAWIPLANLMRRLSALRDLVYACTNQFPPCLLAVLHEELPCCRLDMRSFALRSLDQEEMDPQELALVTSPCLHAVVAPPASYTLLRERILIYLQEAHLRIPLALAPNLKEVSIHCSLPTELKRDVDKRSARSLMQGLPLTKPKLAKLRSLSMRPWCPLRQSDLEEWSKRIDFSCLRVLKFEGALAEGALAWATANCLQFQSLRSLLIDINLERMESGEKVGDNYDKQLSYFLLSLPPLTKLRVVGNVALETLGVILSKHGPSLRKLWLQRNVYQRGVLYDFAVVDWLRQCCPLLEDLRLTIPRFKGNASEVAIYRTLGAIPRLQTLKLRLECSSAHLEPSADPDQDLLSCDPSFDEFDRQLFPGFGDMRNGDIRDRLINTAIDETLARAIFQCISTGKKKKKDPAHAHAPVLPLQKLELVPINADYFRRRVSHVLLGEHFQMVDIVKQSWVLEQYRYVHLDDLQKDVTVRQIEHIAGRKEGGPSERYLRVFRKIWPPPPHQEHSPKWKGDWGGSWHSWPLQEA
ncbi:hypothetical protein AJ80_09197 [Polytolypa hystricis UAMH7299]|uniref:F-box domain-containing protein n=1 Tax=Polytolypa hystricis (strain UAMH7299) TaxID=1447883 RepID=A0A2B7WUN6_POLH7|nr:hypothetical protein AJ80_09197 [Polytolypa hystricis UAMH7299]